MHDAIFSDAVFVRNLADGGNTDQDALGQPRDRSTVYVVLCSSPA